MHTNEPAATILRFGVFEADVQTGELTKHGKRVRLQEQPFQLLVMLLEKPGEVVTREELRSRLWPQTIVDFDHGLNKAISKIREVLGDSSEHPRFVETVARRGYRFLADVAVIRDGRAYTGTREPAYAGPPITLPSLESTGDIGGQHNLVRKLFGLGVAVAIAAAAAWAFYLRAPFSPEFHSLAVLPLENLSGDPSQDYFADGMTDELITRLGQISSLRVISRTSVMQYKGSHKPLPQIARELGVDAVVEGTVLKSADQVRITAQLIQGTADNHLWAESYQGNLRDVLGLQNQVANAIAKQIQTTLAPRNQIRAGIEPPVNPDAYESYLKGEY